jgi:alpha-galactosidase
MTWSRCRLLVAVTVLGLGVTRALAIRPTSVELETVRAWTDAMLAPMALSPPFSFVYGGRVSGELLPAWVASSMTRRLGRRRTQQTLTWRDPATGLVVRCVAIHYRDSPTVEWTLHFENTGAVDTPILEAIDALDIHLERGANAEFLLHHNVGSVASRWDYAPLETPLVPGTVEHFSATGGRPPASISPTSILPGAARA